MFERLLAVLPPSPVAPPADAGNAPTGVRALVAELAGATLRDGLYRFHTRATAAAADRLVATAYPEFAGRIACFGGLASRRTSAWPVATLSGLGGLLGAVALAVADPGSPTTADWWWSVMAGVGTGVGIAFLYRGFAAGQMAVAGPISAVGTALLPVLVGVLGGERLDLLTWTGIAAAVPGLWLVARSPDELDAPHTGGLAEGLTDGVLAGLGFGVAFVGLGQWSEDAGYLPFAAMELVNVVTVVGLAVGFRQRWRPQGRTDAWGVFAGVIATGALVLFVLAVGDGSLAVAAVLTSLYPAVTVVLAIAVLRERVSVPQAVGLLLCAGTVSLVAAG